MHYVTLKKHSEFVRAAKLRNMTRSANVWVQCFSDKTSETTRIGYTASKKVGGAVERNRAKRRLRSIVFMKLKNILTNYPAFSGDLVIIANPYD